MKQKALRQLFPIVLTVITFIILAIALFGFIHVLNFFPTHSKIALRIHFADILVGLTIYLKTSVDFAMFIGNVMHKNPGMKNRIAIEIGTALGNASGTLFVLLIWTFFKEVPILMAIMIFLASLVLFTMAEDGLEEFITHSGNRLTARALASLRRINRFFAPLLNLIIPNTSAHIAKKTSFLALLMFSFTIPLILGLDDFAGYIPLFNIINVFGFALGVFFGHMALNIALFASPKHTTALVRQPIVALLGSIAFIGIGLWGFVEISQLILRLF